MGRRVAAIVKVLTIKKTMAMAMMTVTAMGLTLNPLGRDLGAIPPNFSDQETRMDRETWGNQESQMVIEIVIDEEGDQDPEKEDRRSGSSNEDQDSDNDAEDQDFEERAKSSGGALEGRSPESDGEGQGSENDDEGPDSDVMVETSPVSGVPAAQYPPVTANAAILMDGESGQVCYERQAHSLRPPASTTKIMTAILAIESGNLDSVVTVSDKAASTGEASLHLQKGQKVLLRELVEGALVRSGNDACVAISEAVSGDVDFFVRNMNRKAVLIGAVNTKFFNPNGLPHAEHLSTAYDLALIARYALHDPIFAQFVNETYGKFESVEPRMSVDIKNTNKLLHSYPLADGVKTGTTNAAGKCLVASATKDGRQLVCVVLDAPDRYGDCQRLFDWGFENTENVKLGKKGDSVVTQAIGEIEVPFCLSADVNILVRKGEAETLRVGTEFPDRITSIHKGEVGGDYVVFIGEQEVFRCALLADADVDVEEKMTRMDKIRAKIEELRQRILP